MLEGMSAQDVMRWMAFLAVRNERIAEARRDAANGFGGDNDQTFTYEGG